MRASTLETLISRTIGSASQPLTRKAIEAWQGERLHSLVAYCREHSPFYRRKLAAAQSVRKIFLPVPPARQARCFCQRHWGQSARQLHRPPASGRMAGSPAAASRRPSAQYLAKNSTQPFQQALQRVVEQSEQVFHLGCYFSIYKLHFNVTSRP